MRPWKMVHYYKPLSVYKYGAPGGKGGRREERAQIRTIGVMMSRHMSCTVMLMTEEQQQR